MDSIKDVLKSFKPTEDKYISREFQSFAVHLAKKLNDEDHMSLYMRLAKTMPRPVLEEALRFVVDSRIDRKGALFMWKLKEMGAFAKSKIKSQKSNIKTKKSSIENQRLI